MNCRRQLRARISAIFFLAALASLPLLPAAATQSSPATGTNINVPQFTTSLYSNLQWRCIGPFRAGRTVAPIFDGQPTGSIGALAVAPSNPDIIYVGSGEGLRRPDLSTGDGIYKSSEIGRSWQHLGLRDGQQITNILIDPQDPNRVFVAVLGHPYGPNPERGVFRS